MFVSIYGMCVRRPFYVCALQVVKFHPNGNYLGTGSSDRTVRLWDVVTGECVRVFSGHKGAITALAFSPDGKYLAAAGVSVCMWVCGWSV